ncbi:MAG TPA: hypothetical protein VF543_02550 [Pyrinomonadaceae bacterium]
MSEELLEELIKIRAKASLTPYFDYRFARLEDFLVYTRYLATYTQEEKDDLLAKFNKLSEQEKLDLLNRTASRTSASVFYLSEQDREKLETGKKNLSFHERARISDSSIRMEGFANVWLDFGEVSDAIIEIDDRSSPERESRPYAYISFSNSYQRRVETIDIFESIKANPASIGHPVIIFAIYHWQRVIYTRRVIKRDDIIPREGWERAFKDEFEGVDDLRTAERNLKAISKTLYEAARDRAISKEAALALKMSWYGLQLEDENTALHFAWENLEADAFGMIGEVEEILAKVEVELRSFSRRPYTDFRHTRISGERVMEFLRDDGEKGGRKFVGFNEDGKSLRQSWKVFRNAFAAWFFGLDQSSVQDYLEKSTKESVVNDEVYIPSLLAPQSTVSGIWHYLLGTPLATAQEPIWIREDDMGFRGVADAIEKTTFKPAEDEEGN